MEREVHTVRGYTGEYEDARDWPVRAFLKKDQADTLAGQLNDWCKQHKLHTDDAPVQFEAQDSAGKPALDPNFHTCGRTGVRYFVETVPLG
jgi:hypothetical protein